jgi:ferredoxin
LNRRAFFKELFLAGFDLIKDHPILESLEKLAEKRERPPGALAEGQFQQVCTGCDACMIACPINIIMIDDLEKRHPVIYPEKDPCIHCEGYPCIAACPTGALAIPILPEPLLPCELVSSKGNKEHLESNGSQ